MSVTVSTGTPATATPGVDFTALNQTVTFADGQTTASVPLTILDDTAVEGVDETLTVSLSSPGGGATIGSPSTAVVTIDDNDATFDTTPITIPATGTGTITGSPAAPYPSRIHVTGKPTSIAGVEVTLTGFGHQVPVDVDILLVGPGGQSVVLMSDVGGQLTPASGINLTFATLQQGRFPRQVQWPAAVQGERRRLGRPHGHVPGAGSGPVEPRPASPPSRAPTPMGSGACTSSTTRAVMSGRSRADGR